MFLAEIANHASMSKDGTDAHVGQQEKSLRYSKGTSRAVSTSLIASSRSGLSKAILQPGNRAYFINTSPN